MNESLRGEPDRLSTRSSNLGNIYSYFLILKLRNLQSIPNRTPPPFFNLSHIWSIWAVIFFENICLAYYWYIAKRHRSFKKKEITLYGFLKVISSTNIIICSSKFVFLMPLVFLKRIWFHSQKDLRKESFSSVIIFNVSQHW